MFNAALEWNITFGHKTLVRVGRLHEWTDEMDRWTCKGGADMHHTIWSAATQCMSVPTTVIITIHLLTRLSFHCSSWQLLIPRMETSWLCSNASIYYIMYTTCNVQFLIWMSCLETWHWILIHRYLFFNIVYMYFQLLQHKNKYSAVYYVMLVCMKCTLK